jgi:hypothetical protein
MTGRQTVWVDSRATAFVALCDECLAHPAEPLRALPYRDAKVTGSLHPDADVGFTRCRRGHRLSVRRTLSASAR